MDKTFARKGRFSVNTIPRLFQAAEKNLNQFWLDQTKSFLTWEKAPTTAGNWIENRATWFADGTLNVCYNCVDRHALDSVRKNKIAITWESEDGEIKKFTYEQLLVEVKRFANVLREFDLKPQDTVTIYLPLIPEAIFAMLACARLGLTHNVIFAGFGSEAISDRNQDSGAKLVITADQVMRKGQTLPLKETVDRALELKSTAVKNVLVIKRTGAKVSMRAKRDFYFDELSESIAGNNECKFFASEHPLFVLYTSGSTGKPKGLVHTSGGYLTSAAFSTELIFDLCESDLFWCTADIGWITGHTYGVYGPLSLGASMFIYEGAPLHPEPNRFWKMIEKHKITILYTAPTAIRTFMKLGEEWVKEWNLDSLRLLGSVGEPINPEAWNWYHKHIGRGRCAIVDTWWQTETGCIMASSIPGYSPQVPGSAVQPLPGIKALVVDKDGVEVKKEESGFLIIKDIWPSLARTVINDHSRYHEQYWSRFAGSYFTGDGARFDANNNLWILGRVDDVLNVSGHRLGTAEIESAMVAHEAVAEAAVIGRPHEIKGECIVCFVSLKKSATESEELKSELTKHVGKIIGSFAKPDEIRFVENLPKTRSGKIMRRLLRDIVLGKTGGDTSTLEDS